MCRLHKTSLPPRSSEPLERLWKSLYMHMNVFLHRVAELSAACFVSIGCVKVRHSRMRANKRHEWVSKGLQSSQVGPGAVHTCFLHTGGSRKFVKHVLCRTQIKIPRLLAFWVQCRSRCSNDLLQPKISPKLSYYKCPAKPESLLNFPKARFLQQSERLSLIDI